MFVNMHNAKESCTLLKFYEALICIFTPEDFVDKHTHKNTRMNSFSHILTQTDRAGEREGKQYVFSLHVVNYDQPRLIRSHYVCFTL